MNRWERRWFRLWFHRPIPVRSSRRVGKFERFLLFWPLLAYTGIANRKHMKRET